MLNAEQQQTINDSLWVVNAVLKRLKQQTNEDLRQDAFLYLCRCMERFDPDKGIKWTTYAYKNIYLYCLRQSKSQQKKVFYTLVEETKMFALPDNGKGEKEMIENCQVFSLIAHLSKREQKVAVLLSQGYTMGDIANILNITYKKVGEIKNNIRNHLF